MTLGVGPACGLGLRPGASSYLNFAGPTVARANNCALILLARMHACPMLESHFMLMDLVNVREPLVCMHSTPARMSYVHLAASAVPTMRARFCCPNRGRHQVQATRAGSAPNTTMSESNPGMYAKLLRPANLQGRHMPIPRRGYLLCFYGCRPGKSS